MATSGQGGCSPRPTQAFYGQAAAGFPWGGQFCRRFVPTLEKILRPLTDPLKGVLKATAAVVWTLEMEKEFADAKSALCKTALLAHPQQAWELALMADASSDCVGAALHQRSSPSSPWQPLAFFSRKLEPAQIRYLAFEREIFACCAGTRHFRYMLEGQPFTIYTDHKPLTYALGKVADGWMVMKFRQLS